MKANQTERQKSELARRKAMGIALIQKPLRFIAAKTNTMEADVKGVLQKVESFFSKEARYAASKGNGATVNAIARQVINH